MKERLYCIYDRLACRSLGGLLLLPGDAAASRMFVDIFEAPDTPVAKHPDDHELLCLGELEFGEGVNPRVIPFVDGDRVPVITGTQVRAAKAGRDDQLSLV